MAGEIQSVQGDDGKKLRSFLLRYGPLIAWLALIFVASTSEFSAANTSHWIEPVLQWLFPGLSPRRMVLFHALVRKTGHFTEYSILGFLATRAFITSPNENIRRHWFMTALILVCLCAFSDEYHQSFVPSRTASIYDSL